VSSIKVAQGDLQKCITWLNFFGKGWEEWEKACVNSSFPQKIEQSSENNAIFIFLDFLCSHFFSILTLHSLTCLSFF